MANHPWEWPISQLIKAYRDRSLSPVEVTQQMLDRAERFNERLNAYVTITRELAMEQAREAEKAYKAGIQVGALAGVPISIKDAFHVAGVPTTLGSLAHRNFIAKEDSGVSARLRQSGAVFIGKTNVPEFCQSATTENRLGPDSSNPWDTARTPGGSSGGAAASVASWTAMAAVGSDGGGSIRIPAAFCGLFGLKPSPGVCSDENGFRGFGGFASAGPMTLRVEDARIMLGVLAERDFRRRLPTYPLKVLYCPAPEGHPVDPEVAAAIEKVARLFQEELGHNVEMGELPIDGWDKVFGPIVLEDEYRERGHLLSCFEDELSSYEKAALEIGSQLEPALVAKARQQLPKFRQRIDALFDSYDLLLTPTTAVPAFPLGQRPRQVDGKKVGSLWGAFPFTPPFNAAGVAAATIPCGLVEGLPVGAQLVGRAGNEQLLLDISQDIEEVLGFNRDSLRPDFR